MKFSTLSILFIFLSFEVMAAASSASICRRRGGSWNQWSGKCTYPKSYRYKKTNRSKPKFNSSYRSNSYKKKKYNNSYNRNRSYGNSYKKKEYNYGSSYKKKSYTTYSNKKKSRQPASIKKVALTYCWKTKSGKNWMCDGPTQKLLTGWKDLSRARELVGCSNYTRSKSWSNGRLYECARNLKSYDRDIRGKYGISRNY